MPAGYSGTPLTKKLGLRPGLAIRVMAAPDGSWEWVSPLPEGIKTISRAKRESADFIHLFVKERKKFEKEFLKLKGALKKDGMFWVSWPKKSSKVASDLDENLIRNYGLANGLVYVKVCAIDEVWSGLKFMYRIKGR